MNPIITMPTVHPTKGLTGRRTAKLSLVVFLLQDPETLQTYEEYARESYYEVEGDHPLPTNATNRRHQHQETQDPRQRRNAQPQWGQAGTSAGATRNDIDQDPMEQETPPGTPFDEDFTPSTTRGQTSADPARGVHTENYFTPLYMEY